MRIGNFTSSEIGKLMSNGTKAGSIGATGITYIAETNMERRLGRALENETNARPTTWGNLCERHVFSILGLEYSAISKECIRHPEIDFWWGTPDSIAYEGATKIIVDVKAPYTLKSFCTLIDSFQAGGIKRVIETHKEGAIYYWQLVSNAILTGCNTAELIVYAPYKSELQRLREIANHDDIAWINYALDDELPWLPDGGYYQNLNKLRFEIPEADKLALTARVVEAGKSLVIPVLI